MTIAVSDIAAQAFRLLEMSPISSFGDDSEQAIGAAAQYGVALASCLEDSDWSFASKMASLPAVVETSLDPVLVHVFERPFDLVRVQDVFPQYAQWRLDADRLRADQPAPLLIRYTALVSDETRLPGLFQTAVAYRLASLLAPRWTTSANRAEILAEQAEDWLEKARRSDRRSASVSRWDGRAPQADWRGVAVQPGVTGLGTGSAW